MTAGSPAFWCWSRDRTDCCSTILPCCRNGRGEGFGRALIEFAEAETRRRGFGEIHLYTHALMSENIALYRRLGFVETHRVSEKGYNRVYMTKRLVTGA